ncbi:hypothetical protein Scep_012143 [Stephania cephalantha]|uniref:Reverse transcriptase domain-containing protein n=1 Tax=Stephania cephalantha TaxID=152367 RepID=A0AAP0JGK9_9MAGN
MEAYTAIVEPELKSVIKVEDVPIVCEFSDVFLDDLPGLPPSRAVEFIIELISRTQLIYSRPYRMSASKHEELRTQLEDLL